MSIFGGGGRLTRREEFILVRTKAEVNMEGSSGDEELYRKSLAGDDILFLLIGFGNHEVVKPVRVIVLCVY